MLSRSAKHAFLICTLLITFLTTAAQDKFTLTSTAFKKAGPIPAKYTCEGKNILPALSWAHVPQGTKSFAIIMDDPETPMGIWVHWVIYNIPATLNALKEGAVAADINATDGLNSWGSTGYSGPCPPDGTHNYSFRIYALDTVIAKKDSSKDELIEAMKGHILAKAELKGTFGR